MDKNQFPLSCRNSKQQCIVKFSFLMYQKGHLVLQLFRCILLIQYSQKLYPRGLGFLMSLGRQRQQLKQRLRNQFQMMVFKQPLSQSIQAFMEQDLVSVLGNRLIHDWNRLHLHNCKAFALDYAMVQVLVYSNVLSLE